MKVNHSPTLILLPVVILFANALMPYALAQSDSDENNSQPLNIEDSALNETIQELLNQTELVDHVVGQTVLAQNDSSANVTVPEEKVRPKLNCTPVFRDDSNMTAQLVLVNVSTITRYLQLKAGPPVDLTPTVAPPPLSGNETDNQTDHTENAIRNVSQPIKKRTRISEPGPCTVLIFYLDWCPFSATAAPHFNALARLFPQMNILALDAYSLYSTTMRYGVVGVPSMYVFHSNKIVSKYNKSETNIESFAKYINQITTFEPVGDVNLTESDLAGPLSSQVTYSFNYLFALSWLFCIVVSFYYFVRSDLFRRMKEHVYNMWNEAQFQHEHID